MFNNTNYVPLPDKVLEIASHVRTNIEKLAKKANRGSKTLNGWCAIASAELFKELREANIKSEIHYRSDHVFLVVDDNVVDITATQFSVFGDKSVVTLHYKESQVYDFYKTEKIFDAPTKLREFQIKEKWPKEQIALAR